VEPARGFTSLSRSRIRVTSENSKFPAPRGAGPNLEDDMTVTVKILPNDRQTRIDKLADAELHFHGAPLDGLKLIGFGIWRRRDGVGFNVTFPARQFTVHGDRRNFALLRAIEHPTAQNEIREFVLQVYLAEASAKTEDATAS
jgi:hypothetical protein